MDLKSGQPDILLNIRARRGLRKKIRETGIGINDLFGNRNDAPEGFHPDIVFSLFKKGRIEIKAAYFEYINKVCDEVEGSGNKKNFSTTDYARERILSEVKRTGVSVNKLCDVYINRSHNAPVTQATIHYWLNGHIKEANWENVQYVLNLYAAIPDKKIPIKKQAQPESAPVQKDIGEVLPPKVVEKSKYEDIRIATLEEISPQQLEKLRYYRDEYRFLPGKIFKVFHEPPPAGLNSYRISSWLNGATKTADPELVTWVQNCR